MVKRILAVSSCGAKQPGPEAHTQRAATCQEWQNYFSDAMFRAFAKELL